jgi:glucose 1-dehydrogenase
MRLRGRKALVTGASTGIGRAIAVRFAEEGASVAINYSRSLAEAEITARLVGESLASAGQGGAMTLIQADVADEGQVRGMFERAIDALGPLDILINNAGILMSAASHEAPMEEFDRVIDVNLRGAFLCSREALKHFLEHGTRGAIVNNSSVHEIIPKPNYAAYSISKGGMENMTRSLALEYAGRGIRVNAVGPGAIVTPMNKAWIDDPKARAGVESHIPMGRPGTPEEMAAVFAFLASDDASYITGQTIFACGGLTLFPEFRLDWASGGVV